MRIRSSSVLLLVLVSAVALNCTFNPGTPKGSSITPGSGYAASSGGGGSGGSGTAGTTGYTGDCQNLQCQQSTCVTGACTVQACAGGARTTVKGTVFDPAGKVPLYGITVYVPNKPLAPIADGPSCDPCDLATGTSLLSGSPVAITKTDEKGKFTLGLKDSDVPAGDNIPLVIQVGKWQRQVTIPHVTACTANEMTDANLTRLPRNQSEGHIPRMALTTGQKDAMECLLRKIGIAETEFTPESGAGRINLYAGGGGTASYDLTLNGGAALTPVHPWWDGLDNLKKYDIILHACEGDYGSYNGNAPPMSEKSPTAQKALQDFADLGGRVFASHWHAYWFEKGCRRPFGQSRPSTIARASRTRTTRKRSIPAPRAGKALATWIWSTWAARRRSGAWSRSRRTRTRGYRRRAVARSNISQRWIYASTLNPQSVQYMTATTPIPGGTCGRVVLSDIHVSSGGLMSDTPGKPFPSGCTTTDLTPQEKVIEFMLFDLASCVQSDHSVTRTVAEELPDEREQLPGLSGLLEERRGAFREVGDPPCEQHHGGLAQTLERRQRLGAGLARHRLVEQHQPDLVALGLEHGAGLLGVARLEDPVAASREQARHDRPDGRLVVDDEDGLAVRPGRPRDLGRGPRGRGRRLGQAHGEGGPLPGAARANDEAAGVSHADERVREAEPRAPVRGLRREERLEDAGGDGLRHAHAGVAHAHLHLSEAVTPPRTTSTLTSTRRPRDVGASRASRALNSRLSST